MNIRLGYLKSKDRECHKPKSFKAYLSLINLEQVIIYISSHENR